MTTTISKGWAWVLCSGAPATRKNTRFRDEFDGTYTAACPGCGQDAAWDAYSGEPLCTCGGTS
jgi:hypothetical protein